MPDAPPHPGENPLVDLVAREIRAHNAQTPEWRDALRRAWDERLDGPSVRDEIYRRAAAVLDAVDIEQVGVRALSDEAVRRADAAELAYMEGHALAGTGSSEGRIRAILRAAIFGPPGEPSGEVAEAAASAVTEVYERHGDHFQPDEDEVAAAVLAAVLPMIRREVLREAAEAYPVFTRDMVSRDSVRRWLLSLAAGEER